MEILKIIVDAVCDAGSVRTNNEDMVAVDSLIFRNDAYQMELEFSSQDEPIILAVSDGIGGANAGEVASEFVLNELLAAKCTIPAIKDERPLKEYFEEVIQSIHSKINLQGAREAGKFGMGATLVAVLLFKKKAYYFSAGDSRLYRFRRGILNQISRDHSMAELTGGNRADSHVILNSIGGANSVFIDFGEITNKLIDGDVLLLCSDGVTDMLDDSAIEQQLESSKSAFDLCGFIKSSTPARDNISILLARLEAADDDVTDTST